MFGLDERCIMTLENKKKDVTVADLDKEIAKLKEEYTKNDSARLNQLKVLQADFENYKKRVEKENNEVVKAASSEVIKDILPTLDTFEKAIHASNDNGLKMIFTALKKSLEKHGLKEMKTTGEKFDINKHEAVITVSGKADDNIIVEEVEKGYYLLDKVLRPAKVIVNKKV